MTRRRSRIRPLRQAPVAYGQQEMARGRSRELRLRDVLGAPLVGAADLQLKACKAKLEDDTERVFHAVAGQ